MLPKALLVVLVSLSHSTFAQVQWADSLYSIEGRTPQVGVLTTRGDTLLPFQFHKIHPRDGHRFLVYQSDGRCGQEVSLGAVEVNGLTIPSMYRDIRFPNQFPRLRKRGCSTSGSHAKMIAGLQK
jgi:hypothetical protein